MLFLHKPRQCVKKQRHQFADKGLYCQSYGFPSSHVEMWALDHREGWALQNWGFQIVVLEKTLESPLDSKENQSSQSCSVLIHFSYVQLEWVAVPSSRGSSQPKDWTQVSCIAGRLFFIWATGEALYTLCNTRHVYIFLHVILTIFWKDRHFDPHFIVGREQRN